MSGKCFVDTNILIYAHDRSGGKKHVQASALIDSLWDSGLGVLSTQVLQEFCWNIRRKVANPLPLDEIRWLLKDYGTWHVVTNTPASILGALEIEARYQTSFWDALILRAAEDSAATTLYSEDLAHLQRYGTVTVINPFIG